MSRPIFGYTKHMTEHIPPIDRDTAATTERPGPLRPGSQVIPQEAIDTDLTRYTEHYANVQRWQKVIGPRAVKAAASANVAFPPWNR